MHQPSILDTFGTPRERAEAAIAAIKAAAISLLCCLTVNKTTRRAASDIKDVR